MKVHGLLIFLAMHGQQAVAEEPPDVQLISVEGASLYQLAPHQGAIKLAASRAEPLTEDRASLDVVPERERLLRAYLSNFLDCQGLRPTAQALARQWVEQELQSNSKDGNWYKRLRAQSLHGEFILISAQRDGHAAVINSRTYQRAAGMPCGAAIELIRASNDLRRVAISFKEERSISLLNVRGNVSWTIPESRSETVRIFDLSNDGSGNISIPNVANILDLRLSEVGDLWMLSAEHSGKWKNPTNWIAAIGGHAERVSSVLARQYSSDGKIVDSWSLGTNIRLVNARFMTHPK